MKFNVDVKGYYESMHHYWRVFRLRTVGQNRNHAAKNQKIDFFSFLLKLIPHYSKLFVDLSMYNVLVLC